MVAPAPLPNGLAAAELRELLSQGELCIQGRLVDASNTTLFGTVVVPPLEMHCVYKPISGERPLWDFPDGTLAGREVAAYLVSEATGWGVVPPTVMRDGPLGTGMCQLWVDVDETVDLVTLLRGDDPMLRQIAVFDAVVNNADRKGGHLLPVPGGHIFGVDHGVCFSIDDKLRTILWQWRGARLPTPLLATLNSLHEALSGSLGADLRSLITSREVAATRRRIERLLRTRRFPQPGETWPAVPWPPF